MQVQDLLTSLFVVTTIAFVALMVFDFVQAIQPQLEPQPQPEPVVTEEPPVIATIDWLVAQIPDVIEESPEPVNIMALARTRMKPVLDLTALKLYKLRGESVIHISDLNINIPAAIKRYKLRGKEVIHLAALEQLVLA